MADNTTLNPGAGGDVIASDEILGAKYQRVKLIHGADGVNAGDVATGNPLPVVQTGALPAGTANIGDVDVASQPARSHTTDSIRIGDGTDLALVTAAGALQVDGSAVTQPISAASLPLPAGAATAANQLPNSHDVTVDNAAGAAAVNVQDGGNSLTVDGSVSITGAVDTELTTADLDTGVGTDTRAVVGLVRAESGGGVLVGSANPLPISAASLPLPAGAATAANQLPNSHDVTVDNAAGASAVNVQDGGNSLTVDAPLATPVHTRISDGVDVVNVTAAGALVVDGSAVTQPISAASLPLPAGAATAANQLPNSHDVTVDNAAGASAVNIQDGGNSITVDGSVTVTATDLDVRNLDVAQDDVRVGGMAANNVAVADNPVAVGGRASTAVPTAVSADGNAVWSWKDRLGRQMIQQGVPIGSEFAVTAQFSTAQTGTALRTPAAGNRIIVTYIQIQAAATTASTIQIWYGGSADTTYTRGTDRAIFDGEFAPSATLKPGFTATKESGWPAAADDDVLRITTSAAMTVTVTIWGYEVA